MTVHIGIFVFETGYSLDTAVLAKRAEELGFESIWLSEHTIQPVITTTKVHHMSDGTIQPVRAATRYHYTSDGTIPDSLFHNMDPFVSLARASAVTRTIKLGTGVCLVPERNPLILAKQIATLDHFSGGRFIFGVGAGWFREETEIMGGDFAHRWDQTREAVLAMKELWTKEESEFHGEYYDFPPVRCYPKPARKPHPTVLLGGDAKKVFQRVVEWGDGWAPHLDSVEKMKRGRETLDQLAEQAGRDPASIELAAFGMTGALKDPRVVRELEEAGVNRVTIRLVRTQQEDSALAELDELARQFLD